MWFVLDSSSWQVTNNGAFAMIPDEPPHAVTFQDCTLPLMERALLHFKVRG